LKIFQIDTFFPNLTFLTLFLKKFCLEPSWSSNPRSQLSPFSTWAAAPRKYPDASFFVHAPPTSQGACTARTLVNCLMNELDGFARDYGVRRLQSAIVITDHSCFCCLNNASRSDHKALKIHVFAPSRSNLSSQIVIYGRYGH
jgi:hypothetical protein